MIPEQHYPVGPAGRKRLGQDFCMAEHRKFFDDTVDLRRYWVSGNCIKRFFDLGDNKPFRFRTETDARITIDRSTGKTDELFLVGGEHEYAIRKLPGMNHAYFCLKESGGSDDHHYRPILLKPFQCTHEYHKFLSFLLGMDTSLNRFLVLRDGAEYR